MTITIVPLLFPLCLAKGYFYPFPLTVGIQNLLILLLSCSFTLFHLINLLVKATIDQVWIRADELDSTESLEYTFTHDDVHDVNLLSCEKKVFPNSNLLEYLL